MTLDISHLTLFFMATVCALAVAFVWMFCELERRFGKRVVAMAHALVGMQHHDSASQSRHHFKD